MSWRDAFLRQAKGENEIRRLLNQARASRSHRLHYLQMVTEKLAKGFLTSSAQIDPPPFTHRAFVRLLQILRSRPNIRQQLGFTDPAIFRQYVNSLLELADQIERLAPSAAGASTPNPEYPWRDVSSGAVLAPIDYDFELFNSESARMMKLEALVNSLIRIAT